MFSRKFSNTIHKKKRLLISILTLLVITLGLGYSAFSSNFSFLGSLDVSGYMEPTLYNVLRKEAVTGGLAREYTGEHHDSFTEEPSQKIYHWYSESDKDDIEIPNMYNVIFADQCWQMIRTTDTGGVKMIYNGESEDGKCLNTRNNHVGYASRTSISLNSNYWYGTDYTYDKINHVFSISGTTEQTTWNESTAPGLIGKYTCKQTTEEGTCSKILLVVSYNSNTSANILEINSNSHYSQFGTLQFNASYSSPSYVGYMRGDVYQHKSIESMSNQSFISNQSLFSTVNIYKASSTYYSKTVTFDGTTYTLDNPILGSDIPEETYAEYYTFGSENTISGSEPYYLINFIKKIFDYDNYYSVRLSTNTGLSNYNILIGDSLTENMNGTYTLNNTNTVSPTDWFTNYGNYNNKYTCGDSSTLTCTNPRYLTSTENNKYDYIDLEDKIMISKERNNLTLTDTLLVRKDELITNSSNYTDYKYTCNTDNSTCTEENLRLIKNYKTDGYTYVPNYYYGTSVSWDGTNYTLQNTIEMENYDNLNNLSTHHYMCTSPGLKTCQEIAYIYYYDSNYYGRPTRQCILLKNGVETIAKALEDMFTKNTNSSTIKIGIDAWYKKYILPYDNQVEDTIFCNDRSFNSLGGFKDDGGQLNQYLNFKEYPSITTDLSCTNSTDKFSVSNNSAKLSYKVGLVTSPEMNLLGRSRIRKTSQNYWMGSPSTYHQGEAYGRYVDDTGYINYIATNSIIKGVRPVISVNPGTEYSDGNGSMEKPYYIGDTYNITNSNNLFKVRKKAAPNYEVQIYSDDYVVTSFKLNGTLLSGDTFIMPDEDVSITDIQYIPANYTIINTDNDITTPNTGRYGSTITLKSEYYKVTSFKLNGTLVNGDSFVMPAENVTVSDISKTIQVTVETAHYPYPNSLYGTYYENTFENATSLTVELTYQTETTYYDWVYLYDSSGGSPIDNKKYGGSTKKTETITVNSNYLKIVFRTNASSNNYYGFKAVITPNYD